MKSQALIMNVIGAILLFVGILVHIVCMATPNTVGVDLPSVRDEVHLFIRNSPKYGSSRNLAFVLQRLDGFLSIEMAYGPWKACAKTAFRDQEVCEEWDEAEDWIKATQAFSLLGVLAAIGAFVVSAISLFFLFKGNWKKILPLLACVLACGAACLIIIEAIIFAAKYESPIGAALVVHVSFPELDGIIEDSAYLNWGFGLDIVAAVLLIVAGLIHVLGARAAQREGSV